MSIIIRFLKRALEVSEILSVKLEIVGIADQVAMRELPVERQQEIAAQNEVSARRRLRMTAIISSHHWVCCCCWHATMPYD